MDRHIPYQFRQNSYILYTIINQKLMSEYRSMIFEFEQAVKALEDPDRYSKARTPFCNGCGMQT